MNNIIQLSKKYWKFLLFSFGLSGLLGYSNYTGWRFFSAQPQDQWQASGPGYHK